VSLTVTATQAGSTANGMVLRVFVLTGAKAGNLQAGGSGNAQLSATTTMTVSVTTTQAGSRVYGATSFSPSVTLTANANSTVLDNVADATNNDQYCTFKGSASR
jgi:hypothetical protein